MKLYILFILLTALLNIRAASPNEIEHVLVKRAADAAFTVYYSFLEKDTYPLPKIIVEEKDNDPNTPNKGWFICKGEKCSIHIVVNNHPTENEIVYTIGHELIHTFFTIQGLPVEKHHHIMYCEGYDRIMAKNVGYMEYDAYTPTGIYELCGWIRMEK